jgi:hypothetical protein
VLLNISLSPDQTTTYPITLTNQLTTPLLVETSFADFQTADEDGGYQFVETKTDPLLSWVHIDKDTFLLAPGEKTQVMITVKTPKTIPFGGYYGMIYFSPNLPTLAGQTKILPKIAVLMLGSIGVGGNQTKADILTFSLPFFVQQNTNIPLTLRVKNTGINHFSAKPFVTFSSFFGKPTTTQLEEKYVFPAKVRRWEQELDQTLFPGMYTVQAAVSIGGGKQVFNQTTIVVYPNNQTLITSILIILLLCILILRKRMKKAFLILIAKNNDTEEAKINSSSIKPTTKRKTVSKKKKRNY